MKHIHSSPVTDISQTRHPDRTDCNTGGYQQKYVALYKNSIQIRRKIFNRSFGKFTIMYNIH